jgi:hypothetical protein
VITVHAIPTIIAQSLRLNPAILSANIQDTSFAVLAVSAYAFADTPQPVSVVPVPYESLL